MKFPPPADNTIPTPPKAILQFELHMQLLDPARNDLFEQIILEKPPLIKADWLLSQISEQSEPAIKL